MILRHFGSFLNTETVGEPWDTTGPKGLDVTHVTRPLCISAHVTWKVESTGGVRMIRIWMREVRRVDFSLILDSLNGNHLPLALSIRTQIHLIDPYIVFFPCDFTGLSPT